MSEPHLTPRSLVGRRFAPDVLGDVRIALVGYCPAPEEIDAWTVERMTDQHFIHVAPASVRVLEHGGIRMLALEHVYGGPVSSATVEELAYYGIEHVLAYGLAGGLGTAGLVMGDLYLVDDAVAFDGTTPHYTSERVVSADAGLRDRILADWMSRNIPISPVRAATGDAIYREHDALLAEYRAAGADIVNLDTAHLYAAARANAERRSLAAVQCGVVSDVVAEDAAHESTLATMLAGGSTDVNPLDRVGDLVRYYVEELAPSLSG